MNGPQVQVWSHCTCFSPLLFCSLLLIIFVVVAVGLCLVCSLKDGLGDLRPTFPRLCTHHSHISFLVFVNIT